MKTIIPHILFEKHYNILAMTRVITIMLFKVSRKYVGPYNHILYFHYTNHKLIKILQLLFFTLSLNKS